MIRLLFRRYQSASLASPRRARSPYNFAPGSSAPSSPVSSAPSSPSSSDHYSDECSISSYERSSHASLSSHPPKPFPLLHSISETEPREQRRLSRTRLSALGCGGNDRISVRSRRRSSLQSFHLYGFGTFLCVCFFITQKSPKGTFLSCHSRYVCACGCVLVPCVCLCVWKWRMCFV